MNKDVTVNITLLSNRDWNGHWPIMVRNFLLR